MRRRLGRSQFLWSAAAVVVGCALGASLLWHSKSGAEAQQQNTTKNAPQHVRPHAVVFGVSDPELTKESASVQAGQLARMRAIGIRSVRFDANWDWVQFAGPQGFDWTQLDRAVKAARAAHMIVDLVIDGCPPWAAPPGTSQEASPHPASAVQYAGWAADVAKRYGPKGVKDFEIWNEPNDAVFWQPKPNPAFYVRMLADSYRAIKKVEPSAFIIAGGLAPVTSKRGSLSMTAFLSAMYAHGAKPYFNAIAAHPYSYPALPSTYEAWSGWSQMSQTTPSLRGIMRSHGDWRKPIWFTEFGAPSNGQFSVGPKGEAAELTQAISIAKSTRWIGAVYIYTWQDAGTDTRANFDWFGLLTTRNRPKPAYYAVAKALR